MCVCVCDVWYFSGIQLVSKLMKLPKIDGGVGCNCISLIPRQDGATRFSLG